MDDALRTSLLRLVRYKFATYPNVAILADDIVQEAYLRLRQGKTYCPHKENYGYLSVVCIRLAYRKFMVQAAAFPMLFCDVIERCSALVRYAVQFQQMSSSRNSAGLLQSVRYHKRALEKLRPQLTKLLGYRREQDYE